MNSPFGSNTGSSISDKPSVTWMERPVSTDQTLTVEITPDACTVYASQRESGDQLARIRKRGE